MEDISSTNKKNKEYLDESVSDSFLEDIVVKEKKSFKKIGKSFKILGVMLVLCVIAIFFYLYLAYKPSDNGIKDVSSSEKNAQLVKIISEIKDGYSFPTQINTSTRVVDITEENGYIKYHYVISEGVFKDDNKDTIADNLVYQTCYNSSFKEILNQNIGIVYSYIEENTGKQFVFSFKADNCLNIYTYVPQNILDKYVKETSSELTVYKDYCKKEESKVLIYNPLLEVTESQKDDSVNYRNSLNKISNEVLEEQIRSTEVYEEIGKYLEALSVRYLREDNYQDGFALLQCASINYGDKAAMLRLSRMYLLDDEKIGLAKDEKKSYFWILNSMYSDIFEGSEEDIVNTGLDVLDFIQGIIYGDVEDGYHKTEEDSSYMINLRHPERSREEIYDSIVSHYGIF